MDKELIVFFAVLSYLVLLWSMYDYQKVKREIIEMRFVGGEILKGKTDEERRQIYKELDEAGMIPDWMKK